ncbi:MAG: insulinase family protein, partial [Rhodothermales bacterium]|nr:insulinase family protein [Rhodothermales bacterium]
MRRFEERVSLHPLGVGNVYTLPTSVLDIVSFRGSFRSCPDLTENEDLTQSLCTSTLDKGTAHRTKIEIAEALENVGAEVHFSSAELHVRFHGRALRKDVGMVMELVAEQIRSPALPESEFEVVRVRSVAAARRTMESTADQAERALRRALFDAAHPNYGITPEETIAFYESAELSAVRQFHSEHFGARDLNIVFVGDVEPEELSEDVESAFAGWSDHREADNFSDSSKDERGSPRSYVEVPDKPNSDVAMGHAIPIRRD